MRRATLFSLVNSQRGCAAMTGTAGAFVGVMARLLSIALVISLGCEASDEGLRINELVADNTGVAVDESGETEDVIELINTGLERIWLDRYQLADEDTVVRLPELPLAPGERIVLFADGEIHEGERHLPFSLSSEGETIELRGAGRVERVDVPRLAENESYSRFPDGFGELEACRYATPGRDNSERCGPPLPDEVSVEPFAPYTWPEMFPPVADLRMVELALRSEEPFVELLNASSAPIDLSRFAMQLSTHAPGLPFPARTDAEPLSGTLAAGERVVFDLDSALLADLEADPSFEGVVTLFEGSTAHERVDFMAWPDGAVLTRLEGESRFVFCPSPSAGLPNACAPLASRPIGDRLRHLRTPGDFGALASGGTNLGVRAVKFVLDMEGDDVVHLLGSEAYDLHYTFVREAIDGEEPLDRCDPIENATFREGWGRFSTEQYSAIDTRRYLLGTLLEHAGADAHTVEFATGDRITGELMTRAFFGAAARTDVPRDWAMRPQGPSQSEKMRSIEGMAPIVGEDVVRAGVTFQPLNAAVGYGILRFVPATELEDVPLGSDVIVMTDDVPNDVPLVGGVITEALQTPLAHINVLSRGRGTPNMALRDARNDPRFAGLLDQLVRLEVSEGAFDVRAASIEEAEAFWESQRPEGPRLAPRIDTTVRSLMSLAGAGMDDVPSIGAKAAQLAELARVISDRPACPGPIATPEHAFAIPVHYYVRHFEESGAAALLDQEEARPEFRADVRVRAEALFRVRARMLAHPVDDELLRELNSAIAARWGTRTRVRFRSSSNVEDLTEFSGAGLYTSMSAQLDDPERRVEDALRIVWASLWNGRAYEERERGHIDRSTVAMGVLVHPAFQSELANGIGISRNVLDLTRGDMHYFNLQIGEASVANPAPGVRTDELLYRWGRSPRVVYQNRSSLTPFDILSEPEIDLAACQLRAIHDAFQTILDPERENRFFAMDIEFKLVGDERELVVKQARPYDVGNAEVPADCRAF